LGFCDLWENGKKERRKMKGKIFILSFGITFCATIMNADFGHTEINQPNITELRSEFHQLRSEVGKLEGKVKELKEDVKILRGQLTPEQKELCERICWIQNEASRLEQSVRDIGSAKMEIGTHFLTIIGLLMVVIAIIAGLAYLVLSRSVEGKVISSAEKKLNFEVSNVQADTAHTFYIHYENTQNRKYLDRAIDLNTQTYASHARFLDLKSPDNEKLVCWLRNNLAYYLAERRNVADEKLAKEHAEFIIQRGVEQAKWWPRFKDTYDFVYKQYSDLEAQEGFALACYSRASIFALKGEKEESLSNLKKAIKEDQSYKEKAKQDQDFKKLWDDEDFRKLVS